MASFSNVEHRDYRIGVPRGGLWRVRLNSDAACFIRVLYSEPMFQALMENAGALAPVDQLCVLGQARDFAKEADVLRHK